MSRPIDTLERRASVRGSAEIAAAKHLARTHGLSMRRRRRVGPVIYDMGLRGDPASRTVHGEIRFTDEGRLEDVRLFGQSQGLISLIALGEVLEFGPLPDEAMLADEATTLVVDAVEDVFTGPILLPDTGAELEVFEPQVETPAVRNVALSRRVVSVPVRLIPIPPLGPPRPKTLAERRAEVLDDVPTALRVWARFLGGMALVVQVVVLLIIMVVGRSFPAAGTVFLSVTCSLVGIIVAARAVKTNDWRIDQLRSVGLR